MIIINKVHSYICLKQFHFHLQHFMCRNLNCHHYKVQSIEKYVDERLCVFAYVQSPILVFRFFFVQVKLFIN